MTRALKLTALLTLVLGALAALAVGGWLGLQAALCDTLLIREEKAPGGRLRAVLFSRSCAFDSSPNFQLSLLEEKEKLRDFDTGNVFVGEKEFGFVWKSPNELTVEGLGGSFHVAETFYGFHVEHRD